MSSVSWPPLQLGHPPYEALASEVRERKRRHFDPSSSEERGKATSVREREGEMNGGSEEGEE